MLPGLPPSSDAELFASSAETLDLLALAKKDWDGLGEYRTRRATAGDTRRGHHWNRRMTDPDNPGRTITEKEYIERQGRTAWKMNHTSPTIRRLVGEYLQNRSERMAYAVDRKDDAACEMMTESLRSVRRVGQVRTLETSQLEEHVLSGMHVWRAGVRYAEEYDRDEIAVESVDPDRVFFNRDISDRRLTGLRRIGELHDVSFGELCAAFAMGEDGSLDEARVEALRHIYTHPDELSEATYRRADIAFDLPAHAGLCRVIEVWRLEWRTRTWCHDPEAAFYGPCPLSDAEVVMENAARADAGAAQIETQRRAERVWCYYQLSPLGHVLDSGETPYNHQEHPYVVGFAQWWKQEWWGLVEDIEDPQRLVNRMTTAVDHMMAAAAKGVLVVDEETVERSKLSLDTIASEWTRFNGVIALKLRQGQHANQAVQQITAQAVPGAVFQWIAAQKDWIKELSGVGDASMGEAPTAGTPAALYQQQQIQASLVTLIFFDTFFQSLYQLDKKVLKLVVQYYGPRMVSGERGSMVQFDPARVRDLEWDVALADAGDTAVHRAMFEDQLMGFMQGGHVTFRQALEMSAHPRAGQLLKLIDRTNPLIQNATALQGADPQLSAVLTAAAQAGNMEARTLLMQAGQTPLDQTTYSAQMAA
jgi:hypothetical protein